MASTGHDSMAFWMFFLESPFSSITLALLSSDMKNTFGDKAAQVPQPIQIFLSMISFDIKVIYQKELGKATVV